MNYGEEIKKLIRILGIGNFEIEIDINLSIGKFDSIELDLMRNKIYLHLFQDDEIDLIFDYKNLNKSDKKKVYETLSVFYN